MKRKNKKRLFKYFLLAIIFVLFFLFRQEELPNELPEDAYGPYVVERVVDGDTFITEIDGQRTRVRALCIDSPESVAPEDTGKTNTEEGHEASIRAKELLEGQNIYLEYDEEIKDQFDRTLAYVYLEDGTCFEKIMISEGLVKVVKFEPNVKYVEEFYKLQDEARKNKIGFWGTGYFKWL